MAFAVVLVRRGLPRPSLTHPLRPFTKAGETARKKGFLCVKKGLTHAYAVSITFRKEKIGTVGFGKSIPWTFIYGGITARPLYNLLKDLDLSRSYISSLLECVSKAALAGLFQIWLCRDRSLDGGSKCLMRIRYGPLKPTPMFQVPGTVDAPLLATQWTWHPQYHYN